MPADDADAETLADRRGVGRDPVPTAVEHLVVVPDLDGADQIVGQRTGVPDAHAIHAGVRAHVVRPADADRRVVELHPQEPRAGQVEREAQHAPIRGAESSVVLHRVHVDVERVVHRQPGHRQVRRRRALPVNQEGHDVGRDEQARHDLRRGLRHDAVCFPSRARPTFRPRVGHDAEDREVRDQGGDRPTGDVHLAAVERQPATAFANAHSQRPGGRPRWKFVLVVCDRQARRHGEHEAVGAEVVGGANRAPRRFLKLAHGNRRRSLQGVFGDLERQRPELDAPPVATDGRRRALTWTSTGGRFAPTGRHDEQQGRPDTEPDSSPHRSLPSRPPRNREP